MQMLQRILEILEHNARLSDEQIAAMVGATPEAVAKMIANAQREGVIRGFKTVIDWDKTDREICVARIELKVEPKSGLGFEEIAERVAQFDEVETVYLMSGGYDLALTVASKSFKDVAMFVAHRLAPLDSVTSTSTHFILRKYKERGFIATDIESDIREVLAP